jgi:PAS domain S-box-containing protein
VGWFSKFLAALSKHQRALLSPRKVGFAGSPMLSAPDSFQYIAENSIQGIIVNALDRTPLYANQRCADLFGYGSPEEILQLETTLQLVSNKDVARISALRDASPPKDGKPILFEFEGLRRDGSTVPLYGNDGDVDWQGQPARFTTFFDLAGIQEADQKRIKSEKALKSAEEKYDRAIRGAKITLWDWIIETNDYFISDNAAEVYGYSEANMPRTRDDWTALVHPEDVDVYVSKFLAHIKGETETFEHEYRLRRADGSYSRVALQGAALRNKEGRASRVSGWAIDVSEQRNTERLLVEALHSLSEGFALYDNEDKLIAFNQKYAEMFTELGIITKIGQTFEANATEVFNIRATREGHPVDENEVRKMVAQHLDPPPYTERQISDGRWIRTTEVKTPSGGVAGLRSDITEYKNILERLEQSEIRFRAFADVASDWHFEMDKNLRFTFMSDGIQRDRGMDPEQFIGRTHEEVFAEFIDHHTHQKYLQHLKDQNPQRNVLLRRKEKGKKARWAQVNIIPKHTPSGEFDGYVGSGRDVTSQIEAKQELEQKEAQVSGMLEIAPDAIIAISEDRKVRIFNQGATEIFGYAESEIVGQSLNLLIPAKYRHKHNEHIETFDMSGETSRRMGARGEITGLKKDGTEFPAEASVSRLELGDNTLYTVMLHDISERKKSDMIVRQAMEEALYANRAKSEFLANMSHELRTPLNAILGFSEALKRGIQGPLTENQSEYIDAVSQSGEHLLSLINDILDLSKLEAGKTDIDEEKLDLQKLINQALLLVGERAQEGQIELHSAGLSGHEALRGDKRMVLQMLLNLLSNAIKFTLPGGSVTVSVFTEKSGPIAISVEDTGIGMDAEEIPQALSTFGQLDGDLDRRHEGTGLGLPLVKALVELHGGELLVESQPEVGTKVILGFPEERTLQV